MSPGLEFMVAVAVVAASILMVSVSWWFCIRALGELESIRVARRQREDESRADGYLSTLAASQYAPEPDPLDLDPEPEPVGPLLYVPSHEHASSYDDDEGWSS